MEYSQFWACSNNWRASEWRSPPLGIIIENIFDLFYFFITLHHTTTAAKTPPVNHVGTALVFIQSVLAGFRHLPGR